MPEKKSTTVHVEVENVGCIESFGFDVSPGVTVLQSKNGAGKTCLINAAARAHGADVALEPRDGTEEGRVVVSNGDAEPVLLQVRKTVRTQGAAEIRLADHGPLADLIDPMIKDPEARHARRIQALLKMVRVPVDEKNVAILAGDEQVARVAIQRCRDEFVGDILSAAEVTRRAAHELKRGAAASAEESTGRGNAHELHADEALRKLGGKDRLLETFGPEEAEQQERDLARQFETARVTARQRQELEERQAQVRESLGPKPDPAKFDADIEARRGAVEASDRKLEELNAELRELERRIATHREQMAGIREDLKSAEAMKAAEEKRLQEWEKQAAILDQPVTGPSPEDVRALEAKLEEARDRTARARHSADYLRNREAEAQARQDAKDQSQRAEVLEALATSVRDRLGRLLAGTPASGFVVHDGRLHVHGPDGELLDFEARQSDGERIRRALEAWANASGSAFAPLSGRLWTALDPQARQEAADIAASLGLTILTEEPGESLEILVQHLGGAEAPAETAAAAS